MRKGIQVENGKFFEYAIANIYAKPVQTINKMI